MQARGTPYPTSSVQSLSSRPQIHWLLATASIVVIVACVGWVGSTVWGIVRDLKHDQKVLADEAQAKADALEKEAKATAHPGPLEYSAYTNGEAAHLTFTNLGPLPVYQCVRGVVESKATGNTTKSIEVCTGAVKSHSTVVLEAPYRIGAVQELCQGKPDPFGNRRIDWTLCGFEMEPVVDGPAPVATPAAAKL